MTLNDYIFTSIAAILWIAVIWHRTQAKSVGELWWSCVCIAAVVSFKTGLVAHPFNRLTGGIYLDELVPEIIGVIYGALTINWLVRVRYGSRTPGQRTRNTIVAAVIAALVVTWFAAPIYDIPADAHWIPNEILSTPIMVAHWLVLELYLTAFAIAFAVIAVQEAIRLPSGYVKISLALLVGSAAFLGVCFGLGIVGRIVALVGGSLPSWELDVENVLLLGSFLLFLLAIAIPLGHTRSRRGSGKQTSPDDIYDLWEWVRSATGENGTQSASIDTDRKLADYVVEIMDGMHALAVYVTAGDMAEAGHSARRRGMVFGDGARAAVAAFCLQRGKSRRAVSAVPVPPPRANLAALGRGRTVEQQGRWLGAVAREIFTKPRNRTATPSAD